MEQTKRKSPFTKRKFIRNDRVKYIGKDTDNYFYPPVGTFGTVYRSFLDEDFVEVIWDSGVYYMDDERWFCDVEDLEDANRSCPYCEEYPDFMMNTPHLKVRLRHRTLEIKTNEKISLKVNYCMYCGRELKRL